MPGLDIDASETDFVSKHEPLAKALGFIIKIGKGVAEVEVKAAVEAIQEAQKDGPVLGSSYSSPQQLIFRPEEVQNLLDYAKDIDSRQEQGEQIIPELTAFVRIHQKDLKLLKQVSQEMVDEMDQTKQWPSESLKNRYLDARAQQKDDV